MIDNSDDFHFSFVRNTNKSITYTEYCYAYYYGNFINARRNSSMIILNYFPYQKFVQYNTIIEDEIYFSDSISSVMRKIGTPENTEEYENQTTLEYKRKLHTLISNAYYYFNQSKLCSVCYKSDALTDDESKCFVSEIENVISENVFDSVISYICCGKEYWELSDGAVSMHICLYIEDNIAHIKIDYFN